MFDVSKFHREFTYIKLETESYNSFCSFNNDIQSAIGVAMDNPEIIPDLECVTLALFQFD